MNKQALYETTFIINATLEDHQVEAFIARVQETITKEGGETKAINRWGRKRLAYPIKKKNNGFYVNIELCAPGSIVKSLEQMYILDEHVIRFLTIRVDDKAIKARELSPAMEISAEGPALIDTVVGAEKTPLFDDEEAAAV